MSRDIVGLTVSEVTTYLTGVPAEGVVILDRSVASLLTLRVTSVVSVMFDW